MFVWQISPLRCASVEMTDFPRVQLPNRQVNIFAHLTEKDPFRCNGLTDSIFVLVLVKAVILVYFSTTLLGIGLL